MLSREGKTLFYAVAGPLMRANGLLHRALRRAGDQPLKVHLGPGQRNYLQGWVNVDANIFTGHCDLWADLRHPLPFADGTVTALYSHHVIEHLPKLAAHFRDAYRCLKPGGVYRVGGPNGDAAIAKFIEDDLAWFSDFPDQRRSIGGRFENFIFCRQEHLTILTHSYLHELMSDAGFIDIQQQRTATMTMWPEWFQDCLAREDDESDASHPHTLILEGRKPC